MIGPLANGLAGLAAAQSAVDSNAAKIARAALPQQANGAPSSVVSLSSATTDVNTEDLASGIVGLTASTAIYKANARVVEAADEMLGTLLNTRA